MQTLGDTSTKVDTTVKVAMVEQQTQIGQEEKAPEAQIGQIEIFIPKSQTQGVGQILVIDQDENEEKDIPKEKEQEAIQTSVNLPTSGTPKKVL